DVPQREDGGAEVHGGEDLAVGREQDVLKISLSKLGHLLPGRPLPETEGAGHSAVTALKGGGPLPIGGVGSGPERRFAPALDAGELLPARGDVPGTDGVAC